MFFPLSILLLIFSVINLFYFLLCLSLSLSSLSSKLDELSKLQKQLKSLLKKRKEGGEDELDIGIKRTELEELQQTNERLLIELERERERVLAEEEKETLLTMLRSELVETKRRLLEGQLANGRMDEDLRRLREEIRHLRSQLDDEEGKSRKLRIELMESRLSSLRNPPTLHNEGVGSVTSLPDLNRDGRGQERWTTSSFTLGGEQPDLSELIEKHREVTRLNKELQKKCEERLRTSSGGRERGGGGTTSDRERSYWESRIREAESKGRREKREQEKLFNTRVRLLEEKLIESKKRRKILEEQLESAVQKEEEIERYKNIYLFVCLFICLFV